MGDSPSFRRPATWRAQLRLVAGRDCILPVMDDAERILDEATNWLLALNERPNDRSVQARFRQWFMADSRHGEVWDSLNHSYDLIGQTQPQMLPRSAERRVPGADRPWRRKRKQSRRDAASTRHAVRSIRKGPIFTAAACIAVALWFSPDIILAAQADHRTGIGQLSIVRLEDGSTAKLGPRSAIRVSYVSGERKVDLLAGEALFDVMPDKSRPFRVHADDATVTVLGTGFDVRRSPSGTEIGVQHGRVRVDPVARAASGVVLSAGDVVVVGEDGATVRDHVAPQLVASWALREVNARDRAISYVIDDIRPWYRGKIILTSKALGNRRINGIYDPGDPSKAIRSMVLPLGGSVTQITPWLIVVHE
ncbi:transmembrane sensor [Sphingobium sp. B11D3B]|uniref:FecR family protein n=1 Tax=Sphingobium sp. B11D3B TaxID=2940575 RepID=UPI002225F920|nr:FecR domain-containing protein [Sphingobium sp. B11D3B]MCW2389648.1 transmembrane sensor [Sphingobium sp. B11D3B]